MHMTDTAAADYATVEFVVNTLHRLFPSFDYRFVCYSLLLSHNDDQELHWHFLFLFFSFFFLIAIKS